MKADYEAIRSRMRWISETYPRKKISLPKIGAGLAGGDWSRIKGIIEDDLRSVDVTIVEFQAKYYQ